MNREFGEDMVGEKKMNIEDINRKTLDTIQILCSNEEILQEIEIEHLSSIKYDLRQYINSPFLI